MNICSGCLELCLGALFGSLGLNSLGFSSIGTSIWEHNQDPSVSCKETKSEKIGTGIRLVRQTAVFSMYLKDKI